MSTLQIALPAPSRAGRRPTLARLTLVELRKTIDTRAGFWLQVTVAALTVVVVALYCVLADASDRTLAQTFEVAVAPASILLPILGILLVTSEWSQRTAMVTFALVPQRSRVVAAKLYAGALVALAATAICLPVAAVGMLLGSGSGNTWSLPAELLGRVTLSVLIGLVTGVAFGAMLLSSAPAIVLNFVLPFVSAALGAIPHADGAAAWLDPTQSLAPLTEKTMSAVEWAHAGTTLVLWLAVPLAVGLWRIVRGEIR